MMNHAIDVTGFEERVRCRAYALWEIEGRPFGRHAEHWRASEAATLAELTVAAPARKAVKPKPGARKRPSARPAALEMSTSH